MRAFSRPALRFKGGIIACSSWFELLKTWLDPHRGANLRRMCSSDLLFCRGLESRSASFLRLITKPLVYKALKLNREWAEEEAFTRKTGRNRSPPREEPLRDRRPEQAGNDDRQRARQRSSKPRSGSRP
ncbi:MAG: hypothetical protein MZU79_06805 [Anaerotruncus sp.]|nr:hypothetical protein [Anaerotruncus sp.]